MTKLSPIVSEFETLEHAAAYENWLRAKVAASLADPCPPVSNEEVMDEMQTIIDERKGR